MKEGGKKKEGVIVTVGLFYSFCKGEVLFTKIKKMASTLKMLKLKITTF
jgi:hypothetical protein